MKFRLLNRCQLMTAAAVVVLYIIATNNSVMYVIILRWYTAIKNCNCHCGGGGGIYGNEGLFITMYVYYITAIKNCSCHCGGGGGIYHCYQLASCWYLCIYRHDDDETTSIGYWHRYCSFPWHTYRPPSHTIVVVTPKLQSDNSMAVEESVNATINP